MRRTVISGVAVCTLLAPAAPAFADPAPILTSGMEHPAVARVQKLLGISPQTGYFGPITLQAVTTYQRAHGIPTTGVVGPLTWASLTKDKKAQRTKAKKAKQQRKAAKRAASKKKSKKAASRTNAMTASTLQIGDRGAAVLFLQKELGVQPQTGYFGPITASFVKALQTAAKLPVTGIVDPRTWRKVGKVTFTPPAPAPAPPTDSTAALPAPSNATAAQVLKVAASQAGVPYVATGYSPSRASTAAVTRSGSTSRSASTSAGLTRSGSTTRAATSAPRRQSPATWCSSTTTPTTSSVTWASTRATA
ncbi:MAG: peptidoglycan-binding protein [Micrococcales bacterium]|nr:peptidoglycan-binding protein [Micrococcales bacterium]